MDEIIKEILYYTVLIFGSTTLICLIITGMIKSIFILLDHLKMANTLRKAIKLYIKTNRQTTKIVKADAGIAFKNKED